MNGSEGRDLDSLWGIADWPYLSPTSFPQVGHATYPLEMGRAATGDECGVSPPLIELDVMFGLGNFRYELEGPRIACVNGYKAVIHSS